MHKICLVRLFSDAKLNPEMWFVISLRQDLIGYALLGGQYDARTRVLALTVARSVGVQEDEVQDFEATIVSSFIQEEVLLSE